MRFIVPVVDAMEDLYQDVNFNSSDEGLQVQSVDSSHVLCCRCCVTGVFSQAVKEAFNIMASLPTAAGCTNAHAHLWQLYGQRW